MTQRAIRRSLFLPLLALIIGCGAAEPSQVDLSFVAEMLPHHELGLQIIEIGQYRSSDVRLRRMIFEMGSYHHAEMHVLESLADKWHVAIAQTFPGSIPQSQLDALQTREGNAHDISWLHIMIQHHEGALVIAQQALLGAKIGEIRSMAVNVIVTQSEEIAKMRLLLTALCPEGSKC